jgi:LPXTG-motif cell wall-anchored protein
MTVWIVVGLVIAGALAALIFSRRRRDPFDDLGAVSHQWIAEQRLGQSNDLRR